MWLRNGNHTVLVSPQGGSVLQWQYREHFILGPSRMTRINVGEVKPRGETHWCFPNFGSAIPGGPKHGFLRNTVMEITESNGALAGFSDRATQTTAIVRLYDNALSFGLWHNAAERTPILPALHPYFAVPPGGLYISMDGVPLAFAKGGCAEGVSATSRTIKRTGEVTVELRGVGNVRLDLFDECSDIVFWSDDVSNYVCVEPVFGTPGSYGADTGRWLDPSQAFHGLVALRFNPA